MNNEQSRAGKMPTLQPSSMNNLENQALECFRQGNYTESIALYEQYIEHHPEKTEYYYYLGLNYFLLGEEEEAQATWMSLLMTDNPEEIEREISNLVNFLEQESIRQLDNNKVAIARKIYEQILEIEPNYYNDKLDFKALIAKWYAQIQPLIKERQFLQVIEVLQLILQADEAQPEAWHDLGLNYYNIGEYYQAIDCLNKALELSPEKALYHYNIGFMLEGIGEKYQAMEAYRNAIKLDKNWVEPYNSLGNLLVKIARLEDAAAIYRECVVINPNHFGTAFNLISTLRLLQKYQEAKDLAQQRYELFPDELLWKMFSKLELPFLYNNTEEIETYRKNFSQGLEEIVNALDLTTDTKKKQALIAVQHHNNFLLPYQNFNVLELQQKYGNLVRKIVCSTQPHWCQDSPRLQVNFQNKIKIGYLSGNLIDHAATRCALGWIEKANKQEFEIYCYQIGKEIDLTTEKFRTSSDFFRHIPVNMEEICQSIVEDNLHILIYVDLGLSSLATTIAAMGLAPIQCTTWGHPVTSGLPTIDYFLSCELMEPENAQEHYSEKLVLLPKIGISYPKPKLPNKQKTRLELGLRDDRIIYISCQSLFKYLPQYDYIFPAIAQRVPLAQFAFLELKRPAITEPFSQRLKKAFVEFGLNSEDFCVFLPRLDWDDYLNRNLVSHIYLDSFGWSGGNTTLEAIACNLPVVTCPGEFMRGRHSYGILKMLGVEDTIAYSEQEYIDIAVRLALDSQWRASIVEKIKANQDRVFEDKTCVRALEDFFKQVVRVES